ncbi:MAG: T9SS type A sorting domain-containing protein, partial [Crocinitomicaceae bacterium]
YYVRAVCGGLDGNSLWEGPFCFATALSNDLACGAIELLTDGVVNLHTNEGATINGENQIDPPYSDAINNQLNQVFWMDNWQGENNGVEAPVWFKIKATASGKVEVSTFNDITDNAGTRTEIALYEVGNCNVISNFNLLAANTYANRFGFNGNPSTSANAPRGSRILACDLDPGVYYYVLLDNYSGTQAGMEPGIFGISVTDIPEPNSGMATPLNLCGDGSPVDLFDAIDGFSTISGTWYNPSAVNPGFITQGTASVISLPAGAGTYSFDYVIANACGTDTVSTSITTVQGPNAGMDGYFSTCNTEDVVLLNHLQGFADLGGSWSDVNNQFNVSNGIFSAYGVQYGTYPFYYIVAGNGVCPPDTAMVAINLNSNCLGVDESSVSTLEIFPNPVNDVLTIANLSIEGNATVLVYDAQGKMVISQDISNHSGNYTINMSQLESGLYVVEVNSEVNNNKVRVIKY